MIFDIAKKIFKLEFKHTLNRPIEIKIWSKELIQEMFIDDDELLLLKFSVVDGFYVSFFSCTKNYAALIRKELSAFANLNFNFVPDCVVKFGAVHMLQQAMLESRRQYIIQPEKVLKASCMPCRYKAIKVDFDAFWKFNNVCAAYVNKEISVLDFEKIKRKIPVRGDYKNVRILHSNVAKKNVKWFRNQNDEFTFFPIVDCDLSLVFQYTFNVLRRENLCFHFGASDAIPKIVNYNMRLPYGASAKNWISNAYYHKQDVVLFEGDFYKALCDNRSIVFTSVDWEKIPSGKHLSFNNCFSFFDSDYGQKCLEKIKLVLPFFVEKNVGEVLEIEVVQKDIPSLDDWLLYQGKNFRIVQVNAVCALQNVVKISAVQILDNISIARDQPDYADDEYCDWNEYLSAIKWQHDPFSASADVAVYGVKHDSALEGVSINTPDDVEVHSNAIVRGVC